jgi:hypothetical protein
MAHKLTGEVSEWCGLVLNNDIFFSAIGMAVAGRDGLVVGPSIIIKDHRILSAKSKVLR